MPNINSWGNHSGKWGRIDGSGPNGSPPGSWSVVDSGADYTGTSDSATAIAAAIDKVINNNSVYRTVYFPSGTYKMNSGVVRTLTGGTTLNLVGGGNVLIDATGSSDTYIFSFAGSLGNSLAAGASLGAPIAAGDGQITLATGGVAALGVQAGDRLLLTTKSYADGRKSTGTATNGSPNITSVSGNLGSWTNGDPVQTNPACFPAGTTISSGAGTSTMVASNPAFASSGAGAPVYHADTASLWNLAREVYYKGEIVRIPLANEVSGGTISGDVVQLGRNAFDSYTNTVTTVYRMNNMPAVSIDGLNFIRNGNVRGYFMQYCQPAEVKNCKGQGARDYMFFFDQCDGVLADNLYAVDFWNNTTGTCYGIAITSCQDYTITRCRMFGGRHAITQGGSWPCRGGRITNNTLSNVDKTVPCLDSHENVEKLLVQGNTIFDGIGISASNFQVQNNFINAHGVTGAALLSSRACDYWVFQGNTLVTDGSVDAMTLKNSIPLTGHVIKTVNISNNSIRSNASGIRVVPQSLSYPGWQIDQFRMGGNDIRSGSAQAFLFAILSPADVSVNSFKVTGDWWESTAYDASNFQVNPASAAARIRDTTFKQNRVSGRAIDGAASQGFIDMWFDGCKFTQGTGTTNDSRGCTFYGSGSVTMTNCEFSAENVTGIRNGGVATVSGSPAALNLINCRFPAAATASGIAQANAATALRETRLGGLLLVSGDWALTGWGASAAVTLSTNATSTSGTLIITTNAADTPSANPTAVLTIKEKGYSYPPTAIVSFDSTSTGPYPASGVQVTTANPTAGSTTTNSVSKMTITYKGTPTATSALTYKFAFKIDG